MFSFQVVTAFALHRAMVQGLSLNYSYLSDWAGFTIAAFKTR